MSLQSEVISYYLQIKENPKTKFPKHYWLGDLGRERALHLFRYVFSEILGIRTPSEAALIPAKTLIKHRLYLPLQEAFSGDKRLLLTTLYPEHAVEITTLRMYGVGSLERDRLGDTPSAETVQHARQERDLVVSEIRKLYLEGVPLLKLGKQFGYSTEWVRKLVIDLPRHVVPKELHEPIVADYLAGLPPTELATKYRVFEASVHRIIRNYIYRKEVNETLSERDRVREHVRFLYASGMKSEAVALATGVPVSTIWDYTKDLREVHGHVPDEILLELRSRYRQRQPIEDIASALSLSVSIVFGYTTDLRILDRSARPKSSEAFQLISRLRREGLSNYEIRDRTGYSISHVARVVKIHRLINLENSKKEGQSVDAN